MYTLMSWERKIHRAHAKLFTYLRVHLGTKCDRLSINCSFEGKHVSSMEVNWRNKLPCLIVFSKELSLEILFLHTKRETICSLFSHQRRETPVSCEDRCLLTGLLWAPKLPIINYSLPHDPLLYPQLFLLACEHQIRIEEPPLSLFTARVQFAVWNSGRYRQRCSSGGEGPEQTAAHASFLLFSLLVTLKVSCALFLVLSRSWGSPIICRHTLRSGDCGWHCSEISIASTAVSLQRPSWTAGLICLYYTLPSYDLIWLNVWLREEDLAPTSARNIVCPHLCALLWLNPLRGDEWRSVFCCTEALFRCRLRVCCSLEKKQEQARLFTLFDVAGRNPHCGPRPSPKFF